MTHDAHETRRLIRLTALLVSLTALASCRTLTPRPSHPGAPMETLPVGSPEEQSWPTPTGPTGPTKPTLPPVLQPGEVEESQKPEWMRNLARPDLPMRWYPSVSAYLEMYKNDPRHHDIMAGWLRRIGAYRAEIETVLAHAKLPTGLIFVAMIESGFSASALSDRGAGGFWQFRGSIGRAYGLDVSFWVDERRDLRKSTEAAALYLTDLHHRFQSWELALASYNAGPFAVLSSIVRFNTNDFWTLCQLESGLPYETTQYVPRIFAAAIIEKNRPIFGFDDIVDGVPEPFNVIQVEPTVAFEALALVLGTTVETLERLNPMYLRGRIPPGPEARPVRVPPGLAGSLNKLRVRPFRRIRVESGQTVRRLARLHRVPRIEIRRINHIRDDSEVTPGTVLLLPKAAGRALKR